jgi:glycosyltransferase involved in cell wall biosynthesis
MENSNIHTFVVLAYKESKYLEECIKSVLDQTVKTNILIATSTPNEYISNLANKYKIKIVVNKGKKGIGYDFDFAVSIADTKLVTIAHQDDIYDKNYAEEILKAYSKNRNAIILFPNYYEIKGTKKEYKNINLNIKKFLLFPLRLKRLSGFKFIKRCALRLGNAIGCPSVTFVKEKCPSEIFASDMKCNIDWLAWERLSKIKGKFIYINKYLMGHRIHEESTTTEIIKENIRTKEDFEILCRFWPESIAKIINYFYKSSEKSNNIKK